MPTTSNFGWSTPADTDLVKDGASAIRTLGNGVDTSMAQLKGGTTGQILSKTSNTDMAFTWINNDQGDITAVNVTSPITGGGTSGSVTIGIQDGTTAQKGAVQLENSTSSTSTTTAAVPASVKSAYDLANGAIPKSLIDAAGDLIVGTANDTAGRLGIGTAGQVLKVNSGATALEWGSASSAFVGVSVFNSSDQSISNATSTVLNFNSENFDTDAFHDTATNNSRLTIPSGKGGKYAINFYCQFDGSGGGKRTGSILKNGSTTIAVFGGASAGSGGGSGSIGTSGIFELVAGDYVQVDVYQDSGASKDIFGGALRHRFQLQRVGD